MAAREYTNQHLYRALRLTVETYAKFNGGTRQGNATGFVLKPWNASEPGYLVTNRHVLDPPFRSSDYLDQVLGTVTVETYSPNNPKADPTTITLSDVRPVFLDAYPELNAT